LLLLLAAFAVVAVSSSTVAWRLVLGTRPSAAHRGVARQMWERGWAVGPPEPHSHSKYGGVPLSGHGDDPRMSTLLEQLLGEDGDEPPDVARAGAIAREDLPLLDRADPFAEPVAAVSRGDALIVMQDQGGWLLVAVQQDDRVALGWVRREKLELLP
jgi:hypothetical protein